MSVPRDWRLTTLEEISENKRGSIVSGPFGSNISGKFFVDSGVPVIRGNNLTLGEEEFVDKDFVYITEEKANELRNCEAVTDDIIFTAAGTLGQVGIIPKEANFPRYIISNKQLRLRVSRSLAIPKYVYYWFSSTPMREYIANQNKGSSVPLITLSILRKLPVMLPELNIQRKIVEILSAFDNLARINSSRMRILGEIAQKLYDKWFVHFEFPGHNNTEVTPTQFGKIPRGWQFGNLGDVSAITMGQSPESVHYNEDGQGLPFHQGVTNFGEMFPTTRTYSTKGDRIAEAGDILVSVRAPVGRINIASTKMILGRGLCGIRSKTGNQAFLYEQLKKVFRFEDTMGGGTIFNAVTKKDVHKIRVMLPEKDVTDKFEVMTKPILDQIKILVSKNGILKRMRDLISPKLVAGEIDIGKLNIDVSCD